MLKNKLHNALTSSVTEGCLSFVSRNLCSVSVILELKVDCVAQKISLGGSLSLVCELILSASSDFNKKLAQGVTHSRHSF
jgi:hypothetical protein